MRTLDLTVTELLVDGRACWLFSDGTVLPVIRGGSDAGTGDGGGEGGQGTGEGGEAGGSGEGAEGGEGGAEGGEAKGGDDGKGKGDAPVSMTQAELDALIEKRVAKARKAAEDEAKTKADREKMDEAERLKAEKADAEKAAKDATTAANERLVRAEAKVQAVTAGADPKQVDYVLKLADLSSIDVADDGEPDTKAIRKAIDKVLADVPALKAGTNGKGGSSAGDHSGGHAGEGKPTNLEEAVSRHYANA